MNKSGKVSLPLFLGDEYEKNITCYNGNYFSYPCSSTAENEDERKTLLSMAADEGRHAAILKEYTGAPLKPNPTLAKAAAAMFKIGGKRLLFPFMAEFEINSFFSYKKYFVKYPEITKIASDEIRHGHLLSGMLNK